MIWVRSEIALKLLWKCSRNITEGFINLIWKCPKLTRKLLQNMLRKCSRIDLEKLKICSEIALEVLWLVAVCGNFQVILERIQSNLLQGTWAVLMQFTLFEHYQRAISVQSDCSSRATVEEFLSSWSRALSEQFWCTLKTKRFAQFQNSFSAIWEQITLHHLNYQTQSSLGAILVQLQSNSSAASEPF